MEDKPPVTLEQTDDKPLFLPNGSIRSILAILVSITVCALYAYRKEVPVELIGVWGTILGFYFGNRK